MIKPNIQYYLTSSWSTHYKFYNFQSQRAQTNLKQSASLIQNGDINFEIVTSINQKEFGGDKHALLYKYVFGDDNLMLLIKSHI